MPQLPHPPPLSTPPPIFCHCQDDTQPIQRMTTQYWEENEFIKKLIIHLLIDNIIPIIVNFISALQPLDLGNDSSFHGSLSIAFADEDSADSWTAWWHEN